MWAVSTGLARTPLVILWSPDCAVSVFFVLSGFVLSASAMQMAGDRNPLRLAAQILRRWVRLAGPILGSSLLIWAVVEAGWVFNTPASGLNGSSWLAMHFGWRAWQANSLPILIRQSLFDVFTTGEQWWNAALWTMKIEFWGSLGVFVFQAAMPRASRPARTAVLLTLVALLGAILPQGYAEFVAGALIWDWRQGGTWSRPVTIFLGAIVFLAAIVLGGMPYNLLGTLYWGPFVYASGYFSAPVLDAHRVGAALMVVAALSLPPLAWLLSRPPVLALGRWSFMVYLCHIVVLVSLGSWIVLHLTPRLGYDAASAVAFALSIATVLALACVLTRLVDGPAIRLSRRAERAVLTRFVPVPVSAPV